LNEYAGSGKKLWLLAGKYEQFWKQVI
jgi:hypothetical protein